MPKLLALLIVPALLAAPAAARAHCDTLDGPVVETARRALETGQVNPVLAWVKPADEAEVRAAYARALAVRKTGPEARALADTWFFETLVRVHRAGEGAPFTGLKPAGAPEPGIAAADRAIREGSPAAVEKLLVDAIRAGVHERFARLKAQEPPGQDVAAGRAWVAAYVPWIHYVEGLYEAAHGGGHGEAAHAGHGGEHAEAAGAPHAEREPIR